MDKLLIHTAGYCFLDGKCYREEQIAMLFRDIESFQTFCKLNSGLNGMYCIYLKGEDDVFAYVSPGGFFPLYHRLEGDEIHISGSIAEFKGDLADEGVLLDYRASLSCWTNQTLIREVYALQPGFALHWRKGQGIRLHKLLGYAVTWDDLNDHPAGELLLDGKKIFEGCIDRMLKYLDGRQAVIPLSGGYDSRFILTALAERNYTNRLAVTYGSNQVPEIENARRAAAATHTSWQFIETNQQAWLKVMQNLDLDHYMRYMVHGNSFPCLHELIALDTLKRKFGIENAVVLPGHSGDFLGGSQYVKIFSSRIKREEIASLYISKKFGEHPIREQNRLDRIHRVEQYLQDYYSEKELPASIFEDLDMAEKLTKQILNASRVYSYFGMDSYFPFWDQELVAFFKRVPPALKIEKKLYDKILEDFYFSKRQLIFPGEMNPSVPALKLQHLKNRIRPILPALVKNYLKRKNDFYGYQFITDSWGRTMEKAGFIKNTADYSYNGIIAQWIIYKQLIR